MDLKQFSSLVQNSESIQFDKKSGFFSIGNLHGSSLEPVEATNQVFAKLNGKQDLLRPVWGDRNLSPRDFFQTRHM
jgi:hypothetical protein